MPPVPPTVMAVNCTVPPRKGSASATPGPSRPLQPPASLSAWPRPRGPARQHRAWRAVRTLGTPWYGLGGSLAAIAATLSCGNANAQGAPPSPAVVGESLAVGLAQGLKEISPGAATSLGVNSFSPGRPRPVDRQARIRANPEFIGVTLRAIQAEQRNPPRPTGSQAEPGLLDAVDGRVGGQAARLQRFYRIQQMEEPLHLPKANICARLRASCAGTVFRNTRSRASTRPSRAFCIPLPRKRTVAGNGSAAPPAAARTMPTCTRRGPSQSTCC